MNRYETVIRPWVGTEFLDPKQSKSRTVSEHRLNHLAQSVKVNR